MEAVQLELITQPVQTPNPIAKCPNGVLRIGSDVEQSIGWDLAIDAVDYPVHIVPLLFTNPNSGVVQPAIGDTNTGRDTEHFGIAVDRLRTGDLSVISTVTGVYGTLKTADIYRDLREDLSEVPHRVQDVYVTGSGGAHSMRVLVNDVTSVHGRNVRMVLSLKTSVDGSTRHVIQLSAWDVDKGIELLGIGGRTLGVSARHTNTISDRHVTFSSIITTLIGEWSTTVIPMLELMGEEEFDTAFALDLLQNIMESSEFPDRHIEAASRNYLQTGKSSVLDVISHISEYCNTSLDDKQERLSFFRDKLNRNVKKVFDKINKELV